MKKIGLMAALVLLMVAFASCASSANPPTTTDPYRPINGIPSANILGVIRADFESATHVVGGVSGVQPAVANIITQNIMRINQTAHGALMEAAMQDHRGNIDIMDISWTFVRRTTTARPHSFLYSATGRIVSLDGTAVRPAAMGVAGALERAAEDVSRHFTARSRIAIVYVSAEDRATTEFITGELEHLLLGGGFVIVDRSELDRIRAEQQLGLGFEVDDSTAARIGQFAGASVVITGGVDGAGDLRRLRLRALDTATAQVVGTASERM